MTAGTGRIPRPLPCVSVVSRSLYPPPAHATETLHLFQTAARSPLAPPYPIGSDPAGDWWRARKERGAFFCFAHQSYPGHGGRIGGRCFPARRKGAEADDRDRQVVPVRLDFRLRHGVL